MSEVKISEILLRKRKFNRLNKSVSQESSESHKQVKKPKKDNNNIQRKSIQYLWFSHILAIANTINRKNKENENLHYYDDYILYEETLNDIFFSSNKKKVFSEKTNLKDISNNNRLFYDDGTRNVIIYII